jgi:hypothetical protein
MTDRFDPNIPPNPGPPPNLAIQGEITRVAVTEQPAIALGNAVVNRAQSFDVRTVKQLMWAAIPLGLGPKGDRYPRTGFENIRTWPTKGLSLWNSRYPRP